MHRIKDNINVNMKGWKRSWINGGVNQRCYDAVTWDVYTVYHLKLEYIEYHAQKPTEIRSKFDVITRFVVANVVKRGQLYTWTSWCNFNSETRTDNKPLKMYFHWSTGMKIDKFILYRHQNQIWNRYWKHWAIKHKVHLAILCEMDACVRASAP